MATVLSATPGLLKIANLAGTETFLELVAATLPAQRQAQLLTQLKLLVDARIPGGERLEILEALRNTALETQRTRSKEYWGQPVPFDNDTRETFERSVALWRVLADAYESLIADMAGTAPDLAEHADLVCYRALRCTGFAMTAYNRAYHEVPGALWEQLHRLYAFAESAEVTDEPVSEGDGHSTVNLAYLQIVLAQRANPDALSLLQMNTVERALAQWVALGSLSKTPVVANRDLALAVDLGSAQGARRLKNLSGDNLRYLDIEKIGDKLRLTAIALKTQSPDKLGLGLVPRELCEKLIHSLHIEWLAPGTGRGDERKAAAFNVLMSGTIAAMHFSISGKPFAPPDAGLSSRARFDMAGFERVDGPAVGEASGRSRALETWTVVNQSPTGILGKCNNPSNATRLTHNQLLGLVAPNGKTFLGVAQRLVIGTDGSTWLGFQLLRAKAQAVAARVSNIDTAYDRALLLDGGPGNEPPSIVISPGTYAPSRILDMFEDGKPRPIRLTALLDSGSNFERATFTAA
jgi:cyclic-di-GMP-binding protein